MKTIGTRNLHLLADAELRSCIASASLDVYEASTVFCEPELVDFALDTLHRFTSERQRRKDADGTEVKVGMTATKIGFLG